jgi:hypothetical protein
LDLSNNLLGKNETLNCVKPDFVTGGESLAILIRHGVCPISELDVIDDFMRCSLALIFITLYLQLHWNMIRLEGAMDFCDSIRVARTLIKLDLSFNAIGSQASSVLGSALIETKVCSLDLRPTIV